MYDHGITNSLWRWILEQLLRPMTELGELPEPHHAARSLQGVEVPAGLNQALPVVASVFQLNGKLIALVTHSDTGALAPAE